MPSKIDELKAAPDQAPKNCGCGSSSNKQEVKVAEPREEEASVADSVASEGAIAGKPGGCCGAG